MSKEYKLSCALYGHSLDVRCVGKAMDDCIISGSRDKSVKLWKPNGTNLEYSNVMTYTSQKNFVICVLYIKPTLLHSNGLILAGGNDSTIYVYSPNESSPMFSFTEHSNAVSCLSVGQQPNTFLSASWDCTAKFWNLENKKLIASAITLRGHTLAVWSVLQLQDNRIVTASADKTIGIWLIDGSRLATLEGHTDCVRGLTDFPDDGHFVSVGNDATIRVWSYQGEKIDTLFGHTNYIYSIAQKCDKSGFVTSDEDRTVRCWENGINTHTFNLPAQSVWSVTCLENGDIVTGSSDGIVRIFTQDESRQADSAALARYSEEVDALNQQSSQKIGGYNVSDLPTREALFEPGKRAGQMKMVREPEGVVAYTWIEDGANSHWSKVGSVLGGVDDANSNKTLYEGTYYDFVFSVDVEDGKPPLKLPFNKGDDPYVAANSFLQKNMLPSTYLDEVVNFILKNSEASTKLCSGYVDPFTGQSRYTPSGSTNGTSNCNSLPINLQRSSGSNSDPFTGSSSYSSLVKYFPHDKYKSFDTGNVHVVLTKLNEFNTKIGRMRNEDIISSDLLNELAVICEGSVSEDSHTDQYELLFKLMKWPDEMVFPVLDMVRMCLRFEINTRVMTTKYGSALIRKLIDFVNGQCKIANNVVVSLRTLCNLFLYENGEKLVYENRCELMENLISLSELNKSGQVALATLLLNLTILTKKRADDLGTTILGDIIPDMLTRLNDSEAVFRAYVALGTLLTDYRADQTHELKAKLRNNADFEAAMSLHLMISNGSDVDKKRSECVKQVRDLL